MTKTNALEIAGDRLVRARPVGPRRRGRPRRGAGRPGRDLQVHGVVGLRPDQGRVRRPGPGAAWTASRWTTCSWTPPSSGCTPAPRPSRSWLPGASPPAASPRSSAWPPAAASPPTPGHDFLTDLKDRGLAVPAAGHLRRRARPDRRDRAGLPQGAASTLSDPPARNVLAKVPAGMQAEIKDAYWASSTPRT